MNNFSGVQIEEALRDLQSFNASFGNTSQSSQEGKCACSVDDAPSAGCRESKEFLKAHYRAHPKSECFFRNPRTEVTRRTWTWSEHGYASIGLQTISAQTSSETPFSMSIMRIPESWAPDGTLIRLAEMLPRASGNRVPLFHLAVSTHTGVDAHLRTAACAPM